MKYRYTSAWRMQGGWSFPSEPTTRELVNHAGRRLVLTTDPADFLRVFDRRTSGTENEASTRQLSAKYAKVKSQ